MHLCACTCVCLCICMHVPLCVSMCVFVFVHVHAYLYACAVCMYLYVYLTVIACVCMHVVPIECINIYSIQASTSTQNIEVDLFGHFGTFSGIERSIYTQNIPVVQIEYLIQFRKVNKNMVLKFTRTRSPKDTKTNSMYKTVPNHVGN